MIFPACLKRPKELSFSLNTVQLFEVTVIVLYSELMALRALGNFWLILRKLPLMSEKYRIFEGISAKLSANHILLPTLHTKNCVNLGSVTMICFCVSVVEYHTVKGHLKGCLL